MRLSGNSYKVLHLTFDMYSACTSVHQLECFFSPLFVWEGLKGESILSLSEWVSCLIKLWEQLVSPGTQHQIQLLNCGPAVTLHHVGWVCLREGTFCCQIRSTAADSRCQHVHAADSLLESWMEALARSASGSGVKPVISGEVDCHYGPPAALLSWPDVCHRQMTRRRLRGWRALRKCRKTPEERGDCPRPLVLTGLSFNSICSITAVCVKMHSIGRQIQETLTEKQVFSLWLSHWTCSNTMDTMWRHPLLRVGGDRKVHFG